MSIRSVWCLSLCLLAATVSSAELDAKTGLAIAPGFEVVSVQCTVCHSAKLLTQNRGSRDHWLAMIRWMQETQGLWPLGDSEETILDYLAANYGPVNLGRRQLLSPHLLPE
ncbi:MAG: hypothetical protein ABJ084_03385 [Halioglobus sp.]